MLRGDLELLELLNAQKTYEEFCRAFQDLSFQTLSRKKNTEGDPEIRGAGSKSAGIL